MVQVLILDPPRRGLGCRSWRSGLPAGQEEVEQIRHSCLETMSFWIPHTTAGLGLRQCRGERDKNRAFAEVRIPST